MLVFSFHNAIWLWRMLASGFKKYALFIIEITLEIRCKLTAIISSNSLNVFVKLNTYHLVKIYDTFTSIIFVLNEKNPNRSTIVINYSEEIIGICVRRYPITPPSLMWQCINSNVWLVLLILTGKGCLTILALSHDSQTLLLNSTKFTLIKSTF